MTITIRLTTDNAAFDEPYTDAEIARILERCAQRWYSFGPTPSKLYDSNGNAVGTITVKEK